MPEITCMPDGNLDGRASHASIFANQPMTVGMSQLLIKMFDGQAHTQKQYTSSA